MNVSDRAVSYLRTAVPALWGSLVTWVLAQYVLPAEVVTLLSSEVVVAAVTAAVILAWYAVWRKAEAHVPDWLTRIVLGSAKTPTYTEPGADGVYDITALGVSAPSGYETSEVSDAKTEVADLAGQLEGEDAIHIADRQVERLLELGWRPTVAAEDA